MTRSTPWPSSAALRAGLLLLGLLATAACGNSNAPADFPLSVGFTPLEPISDLAIYPATTAQGLGPVKAMPSFSGHYVSHARGYVAAPLAKVYLALHDPAASYIHNLKGQPHFAGPPSLNVEPFPVSFRLHYLDPDQQPVGDVLFDVTYRAGVLEGTEGAPIAIGERYQKTWGTDYIRVMAGSLRAYAVDGGLTAVELEAWLDATTQGQSNCDGTLTDLFGDLVATVAALP